MKFEELFDQRSIVAMKLKDSIIWELTYLNCLTFLNSMFNQGEPIFVDPAFTVIGTGRDHLPFT